MNLWIDDQIVVEGCVFVVRGFDLFGAPTRRVYRVDEATGQPVTESTARRQHGEPGFPASEDAGAYRTPTVAQDE